MAKGNDGNYLQHSIEIESATRLAGTDPRGRLHIALTHGMAPWEPFREPIHGQVRRLLNAALTEANNGRKSDEPPIVTAYRETRASRKRYYPNTAELLRTVVGANNLSGGITEVCDTKYRALADAWSDSRVVPVLSSWRHQLGPDGQLAVPNDLQSPWLFSMDPMTYTESGDKDKDDCLRRSDLDCLTGALTRFVESDMPGIATLFVYAVRREVRSLFWDFMDELASGVGACTYSYWVPHQGGNRNLAGLLCTGIQWSPSFEAPGIRVGRT